MSSLGSVSAVSPSLPSYPSQRTAHASRQRTHFDSQSTQDGGLQVKTAEGDTVTISFAALSAARADSGNGSSSQSSASAFAVKIKVEGSLNQQEVSDIGKLLDSLAGAVQDLGKGDTTKAASDLAGIGSLSSLKSFQFAYESQSQANSRTYTG